MITVKQMTTLLDIKDAVDAVEDVLEILLGRREAVSYSEGAIGQLSKIDGLIQDLSPVFKPQTDPTEDISEAPVYQIMDDKEMSNAEKAKLLLGL